MTKKTINKRNLKYGGVAAAFTAVVVAAVILLNLVIASLGNTFSWYADLTGKSVYSMSEEFEKNLEGLLDVNYDADEANDLYFNIVLLMDEDAFKDYSTTTYYVYRSLKQVVAMNDHIELKAINSTQNPELIKDRYQKTSSDNYSITDVIIEVADKDHNSKSDLGYKKLALNTFYMVDTDTNEVFAYNAEAKLLSAFAQLSGKVSEETAPVVYYLQGHGEATLEDGADWVALFRDAGFSVKEINLIYEDFPENITKGSILFVNLPKTDLYVDNTDGGVNEVKKIRRFAATQYGNVIVTLDAMTSDLPAFNNLMSEWGVGIGGIVTDKDHDVAGSGATKILADYSGTKDSISKQLLQGTIGSGTNQAPSIFTNPRAIYVYDDSKIIVPTNGRATCEVLLAPYSSAKVDGTVPSNAETALASITLIEGDVNKASETTYYVMCIGSSDFVNPDYDNSNYNKMLMYYSLGLMWSGTVTFDDIKYKAFDDNTLSVTSAQTNAWTIACVAVIPLAFITAGTVVWIRRRHS